MLTERYSHLTEFKRVNVSQSYELSLYFINKKTNSRILWVTWVPSLEKTDESNLDKAHRGETRSFNFNWLLVSSARNGLTKLYFN